MVMVTFELYGTGAKFCFANMGLQEGDCRLILEVDTWFMQKKSPDLRYQVSKCVSTRPNYLSEAEARSDEGENFSLNSDGVRSVNFLNTRLKVALLLNPTS